MTRDDVIAMAKEAGIEVHERKQEARLGLDALVGLDSTEKLMLFAALVASAEREACAALHDHEDVLAPVGNSAWGEAFQEGWIAGAAAYRDAIRARGHELALTEVVRLTKEIGQDL